MTPRADAVRSRERILEVARGHDVRSLRLNDIARNAGVGIGTVYRHFPTVRALVEALSVDALARLSDAADAASAEPGPGPRPAPLPRARPSICSSRTGDWRRCSPTWRAQSLTCTASAPPRGARCSRGTPQCSPGRSATAPCATTSRRRSSSVWSAASSTPCGSGHRPTVACCSMSSSPASAPHHPRARPRSAFRPRPAERTSWTTDTRSNSAPSSPRPPRTPQAPVLLSQAAEASGLDLVTFQDHPYQPAFLDTWTLMTLRRGADRAHPHRPERAEHPAAAARGRGPRRGQPRPALRRPLRPRARRRRLLGRDRGDGRHPAHARARRSPRSRRRST